MGSSEPGLPSHRPVGKGACREGCLSAPGSRAGLISALMGVSRHSRDLHSHLLSHL